MTKTLFFHIGHYKTGTSALQAFLTVNTDSLAQLGIRYPERRLETAKHSTLAFSIYQAAGVETLMHGYRSSETPQQVWDEMIADIHADPAPTTVISSEEFIRMGAHSAAIDILRGLAARPRDGIEIRVIAWLRAPDAHLRSWYNQLIKMNFALPDYNTAVRRVMEPVHYDYALALRPWVDIFGADAVQVRPYHDGLRQGVALYDDFLSALGVDRSGTPEEWWHPEEDLNPRLDPRLLELTRVMQARGMEEPDIAWAQKRALKRFDAELRHARPGDRPFSEIETACDQGLAYLADLPENRVNMALFRQNLPRANDPLQAEMLQMLALVIDDVQGLRERLHQRLADLTRRMDALEARATRE